MIKSYLVICFLIPPAVALCIIAPSGSFPENGGAAGESGCLPPFPAPSDRTFLYQLHLCQKRPLSVLSPSGLRFLFCFASCMDFLSPPIANSLPPTSAFFFCLCVELRRCSYTHTHSLRRCCFPSALHCPQLLTIAAFFCCVKPLTGFQPSFPLPPLIALLWPILFPGWVGWFGSGSFAHLRVGCDGFQVTSSIPL